MRYFFYTIILVFGISIFCVSCKTKKISETSSEDVLTSELSEVFDGKKYKCLHNGSKDLKLCIADDDPAGDRLRKVYAIYDNDFKLVYGPKKVHGKVLWAGNDHILIEIYPRVMNRSDEGDQIKREQIKIR